MANDDMFPTVLTVEEKRVGFRIVEIPNPKKYFMEPPAIRVAARTLRDGVAVKLYDGSYAIWESVTRQRPIHIAPTSFEALMVMYPPEVQAKDEPYELVSDKSGQLVVDHFASEEEALDRALEYCLGTGTTRPQRLVRDGRTIKDREAILRYVGPRGN